MTQVPFGLETVLRDAQGLIFDCDGTLLDTLDAWREAEAALFAATRPLTQEEEVEIHSAPIAETARLFHEKYGVLGSAQEVLDHLDAHLLTFYGNEAQPIPGALEFVHRAHDAKIPSVVLSSSPRGYLEAGLEHAGILHCFRELISTEDLGIFKSDPAIFAYALEVLGSPRSATWGIDDAAYAIGVMHDFGLRTVKLGKPCPGADLVVETLERVA